MEPLSRDPVREMNARITEALDAVEGDLIPSVLALEIVQEVRNADPGLLAAWLEEMAPAIVTDAIKGRISAQRSRARAMASRRSFAADARLWTKTGDPSVMSRWSEARYVVDANNTQRFLLEMNRKDLEFAAGVYGRSAKSLMLEEAFLLALAGHVGDRTVGDVFTEDQITEMFSQFRTGTATAVS